MALGRFEGVEAQVLGLSVDSVPCLKAWADSLGGVTYPLLSDFYPHGQISEDYDVLRSEGYSERAIYVIDKEGVIRYVEVSPIDEQPDNEVLFNVLKELEPELSQQVEEHMAKQKSARSAAGQPDWMYEDIDAIMFCTPWCPDCRRARAYLKERGVNFREIDLSIDRRTADIIADWTGGYETTPSFYVRGQVLHGYKRAELDRLLGLE